MSRENNTAVLKELNRLFTEGTIAGLSTAQLLNRFTSQRDEAAFVALVDRLGPIVLGVCRRILNDPRDVEDAFQATFLILVKKARGIRDGDQVGPWIYGVARRVALRARAQACRRRLRERSNEEAIASVESPPHDSDRIALRWVLDEEIGRLPEKYRFPIVLCYLEGLTHEEAARRLRCPVGTVHTRMARARAQLRTRLDRRGLALPSGVFALVLVPEAVPAALLEATRLLSAQAIAGKAASSISTGAVALAHGVQLTMFSNTLKNLAVLLLTASLVVGGARVFANSQGDESPKSEDASSQKPTVQAEDPLKNGPAPDKLAPHAPKSEVQALRDRTKALEQRLAEMEQEIHTLKKALNQFDSKGPAATPHPTPDDSKNPAPIAKKAEQSGGDHNPLQTSLFTTSQSETLIVAFPETRDRLLIYVKQSPLIPLNMQGTWHKYTPPQKTRVIPVLSMNIIAPTLSGGEIPEVAVFNGATGQWYTQKFTPSAKEPVSARFFGDGLDYVVGNKVYSFLTRLNQWTVLEVEKDRSPTRIFTPFGRGYKDSAHQFILDPKSGKWTEFGWDAIEAKAKANEKLD